MRYNAKQIREQFTRFMVGLVSYSNRVDCYYEKFDKAWRELHRDLPEGWEVRGKNHHLRAGNNECSLVNWVLNFGVV